MMVDDDDDDDVRIMLNNCYASRTRVLTDFSSLSKTMTIFLHYLNNFLLTQSVRQISLTAEKDVFLRTTFVMTM